MDFLDFSINMILILGHLWVYEFALYFWFQFSLVLFFRDAKGDTKAEKLVEITKEYPIIKTIHKWHQKYMIILGNITYFLVLYITIMQLIIYFMD